MTDDTERYRLEFRQIIADTKIKERRDRTELLKVVLTTTAVVQVLNLALGALTHD